MEKSEAIMKIKLLIGQDIRKLADEYEVTVNKNEKINKGWFGHVIERYLGLPINSSQSPNFGSWELKTIPIKKLKNGNFVPKETMAITMIDPFEVKLKTFYESHLYSKLKKMVIVTNLFESKEDNSRILLDVLEFDLENNNTILNDIENDCNLIRNNVINFGFKSLSGKMGKYIQPRTKGAGHGSISRAFYMRTTLIKEILKQ